MNQPILSKSICTPWGVLRPSPNFDGFVLPKKKTFDGFGKWGQESDVIGVIYCPNFMKRWDKKRPSEWSLEREREMV